MIRNMKDYFADWTWFERIWLLAFTIINIYLFFAWDDTAVGLIASLTGMLSVVLVAKGKTSNYYPGIINVILYAYIAYGQKYYGEVMLNLLYFLPMQFLGLVMWRKHRLSDRQKDDVAVSVMSHSSRAVWAIVSLIATIVYGVMLEKMGGNLPYVDSATAVLSIIAMFFMVKRFIEQWVLWILIDVASIYMWWVALQNGSNDISILIMWTAYLVNAVYGFLNWIKLYQANRGGSA